MSSIDYAVMFFSPEGAVVEWLGAAERLFGYTAEEAMGLPFSVLFTAADKALGLDGQELALARANGRSEDDRWHVRRDGSQFWASGVLATVADAQGNVVALCKIVRDRTDVRTQIESLENQLEARLQDIARRDRFVATVSHELRNPIVPIVSAVAILQRTEDAALRVQAHEIIDRNVVTLKQLINDLDDQVQPTVLGSLVTLARMNVADALREVADSLRETVQAQGLALRVVLPSEPIWVAADRLRLQQMLLNLLGNAVKYTPAGGHVTLSATAEADMAVIRVEDNGRGIAPDILPRIFELFTREERGTPVPGMGVGLAVVKDLARRHGGNAEARSPGMGRGSIFAIRLPMYRNPDHAQSETPYS